MACNLRPSGLPEPKPCRVRVACVEHDHAPCAQVAVQFGVGLAAGQRLVAVIGQ